jgi:RNA polymerase sigma factor (sigma-70 family)
LEIGVVHPIAKDNEFVEENQYGMVINRMKSDSSREEVLRQEMVNLLPRLRGFARSLAKEPDQADDLVQAACERALDRLHQVVKGTRLDSWLYRIIYTQWIDKLRRGKSRSAKLLVLGADNETVAADGETGNRMADLLDTQKALDLLPAEHRAAITLVCVEGYSYEEAASVLDLPVGTVASRVARARAMLSRFLALGRQHGSRLQRLRNIRAKGE